MDASRPASGFFTIRGMMGSAAVMYSACAAATPPLASMRSATGARLSSRARSSQVLSGSAGPGPTGHAIVAKITLAAGGNRGRAGWPQGNSAPEVESIADLAQAGAR